MTEFDDLLASETGEPLSALRKGDTRDQAIARGAQLGEDEADRRRETGRDREQRIARASAYAAWEWDGKPSSSAAQRKEFRVAETELSGSLERADSPRLLKP